MLCWAVVPGVDLYVVVALVCGTPTSIYLSEK